MVKFGYKMEVTLGEMQKLLPGSSTAGLSRPSIQAATPPPPKEMSQQQFEELKACVQQHRVQEVIAEATKIEVPTPEVPPMELPTTKPVAVPTATPTAKAKKTEKDLDTKTTSSKLSSQRKNKRKKKKEPSPEFKDEEESTEEIGSSGGDEEEEPVTPPPVKRPRMGTCSTDQKKKPESSFKTPIASKRPSKSPRKGESSQKSLRGSR